ncbi:Asp-tRNA(Asn)/Glu-tRNA(Gln) amidotransferase subunit GatB [bacterium]|nr:Asp-tRNA(Asn)/Glu-tRNA(Gln) amidotransferase subunit GatB [bacterium]MBU1983402.1 Asp-tRNA(Asn)/Glu-tRNA(Gln) amidotransferase subunit GatB [bacterium]
MNYELIVGLEIHAQLLTETKAFCRCPNRYGESPNTLACPTCLGMPGALPVLNRNVVEQAALLALALNATVHPRSKFDRKNYFYPDLPKGYQISQYDEPFSTGGWVDIEGEWGTKRIRITRAHIEEDAGKSLHQDDGSTIVDMNRCGVPLVEIVTEPDFRTELEAGAFVGTIRGLLRFVGVCDGNMERGSLRCDVNISVRPSDQESLNERTEIKNLNSIRAVERAIRSERERQIQLYTSTGTVIRQTLLWDETLEEIRPMRRKEGSDDYRYFPEPDLVEVAVSEEELARIRRQLPELPDARRRRYREELKLHEEAVSVLASDRGLGDYFETLIHRGIDPRSAAAWMQGEVRRALSERGWGMREFPLPPPALAELIQAVQADIVSLSAAKDVFWKMLEDGRSAREIIEGEGLAQTTDTDELRRIVEQILAGHPEEVKRYKSGKKNLLGFFMGEAMKVTKGSANPKIVNGLLREILDA